MRRTPRIYGGIIVAVVSLLIGAGCEDGVRQTVAPYFFTGLQTIAAGLVAGLEQQVYPEGSTSTAQSTTTSTSKS